MFVNRRRFLGVAAAGLASSALPAGAAEQQTGQRNTAQIKALAFDAFAVFDPRPIAAAVTALFPDKATDLMNAWRTRQFEYTWLRSCGEKYRDFWQVTSDALAFAARSTNVALSADQHAQLMQHYLQLEAWPDAAAALKDLKGHGLRLAFLSNFTPEMLNKNIESAALPGLFQDVLSTDAVQSYKPDPKAYQLAMNASRLSREEILFVPFAAWDMAGAKWFGYPTFWVNRANQPAEELGAAPDGVGTTLRDLAAFVLRE